MEKFAVDPRMVTTPLGAAVGWVLAKKVYKEKATLDKKLVGAGLGAGAGYTAGEFLRADPPWQHPTGVKSKDRNILDSMLRKDVGKVPINQNTTGLVEGGYGSLLGDVDTTDPVASKYIDQSVMAKMHRAFSDRYRALARREPERAEEFLQAANMHQAKYNEGIEQIRGNASSIRNQKWWQNFKPWSGG